MPLIPALGRQMQVDPCEFKANLDHRASFRTDKGPQRNPVSKKQNKVSELTTNHQKKKKKKKKKKKNKTNNKTKAVSDKKAVLGRARFTVPWFRAHGVRTLHTLC